MGLLPILDNCLETAMDQHFQPPDDDDVNLGEPVTLSAAEEAEIARRDASHHAIDEGREDEKNKTQEIHDRATVEAEARGLHGASDGTAGAALDDDQFSQAHHDSSG